jgi:hypothetical protein
MQAVVVVLSTVAAVHQQAKVLAVMAAAAKVIELATTVPTTSQAHVVRAV